MSCEVREPGRGTGRGPLEGRPGGAPAGARRLARGAALACALLLPACSPMDDVMHAVFGRSMRDQPSFDPYENPQPPPANAVPFASGNYPAVVGQVNVGQAEGLIEDVPELTQADLARGGPIANGLANPVPATPESLARGEVVYDRMCAVCHGPQGNPAEAPIMPKLGLMAAFPLASGAALTRSDGYIYGMIAVGRGVMPEYGHRVTHFDRWHVVNYVRQLQGRAGGPAADSAAAPGAPGTDSVAAPGAQPADTAGAR